MMLVPLKFRRKLDAMVQGDFFAGKAFSGFVDMVVPKAPVIAIDVC